MCEWVGQNVLEGVLEGVCAKACVRRCVLEGVLRLCVRRRVCGGMKGCKKCVIVAWVSLG